MEYSKIDIKSKPIGWVKNLKEEFSNLTLLKNKLPKKF